MDYCSNFLSIDPDNIFKPSNTTIFNSYYNHKQYNIFRAQNSNFNFYLNYSLSDDDKNFTISKKLIEYTDKIFYNNGLYDKLYYDTSFTLAKAKIPEIHNLSFKFYDLIFDKPESIFYFTDELKFVCAMWNNLEFKWL